MALKTLAFSLCTAPKSLPAGWLHGKKRDNLKRWFCITSRRQPAFRKTSALPHAEALRESDLDAGHVVSFHIAPGRNGKAEVKNIMILPSQEVIDTEDRVFREYRMRNLVKLLCGGRSRPKGFSTITRAFRARSQRRDLGLPFQRAKAESPDSAQAPRLTQQLLYRCNVAGSL